MFTKRVGKVTESEKNKILSLFERMLALEELEGTLNNRDLSDETRKFLAKKILVDKTKTSDLFDEWWKIKSMKYSWERNEKAQWKIDFNTNEVFLVKE